MTTPFLDSSDSMNHSTFEAPGDDAVAALDKHPALQPPTAKWHLGFDTLNGMAGGGLALMLFLVSREAFWIALGLDPKTDPNAGILVRSYLPIVSGVTVLVMGLALRLVRFPGLDYLNAGAGGGRGVPGTATVAILLAALGWITFAFARSPFLGEALGAWHLPLSAFTAIWLLTVPAALLVKRLLAKA